MDMKEFEQAKLALKESYIGNECETDEYRETQPGKGCEHIGHALGYLRFEAWRCRELTPNPERSALCLTMEEDLTTKLVTWVCAYGPDYGGTAELEACLEIVFEASWMEGLTPYFDTEEELQEAIADLSR